MIEGLAGRLVRGVLTLAVLAGLIPVLAISATPVRLASRDAPVFRVAVIGDSYTNGTDAGGLGPNAWTTRAWQTLARQGIAIRPDVAAEGRAGYVTVGNRGSVFADLTARAVRSDDTVIVFYGSRNDQGVPVDRLNDAVGRAFAMARTTAPTARLLVIGPPWPTADVPVDILQIRDVLASRSRAVGATFIDPIVGRWFVDQPWLIGADGVHPTDAGHAYMADAIAPLIAAQLPRGV